MHRILAMAKAAQEAQMAAVQAQQQQAAKAAKEKARPEAAQKQAEQEKAAREQQEREAQARREAEAQAQREAAERQAQAEKEAVDLTKGLESVSLTAPVDSVTENIAVQQLVLKTINIPPSVDELTGEFSILSSPFDPYDFALNINNPSSLIYYQDAALNNCAKYPKAPCLHPYNTNPGSLKYYLNAKVMLSAQMQQEVHANLTPCLQKQLEGKSVDYFVVGQIVETIDTKDNPLQFKPQHWLASNTDTSGKCETFNCNITLLPLDFQEKAGSPGAAERTVHATGELSFTNTVFTAHDNTCSGSVCPMYLEETKDNQTHKFISVVTTGAQAALTLHTVYIYETGSEKEKVLHTDRATSIALKEAVENNDKLKAHEMTKEMLLSEVQKLPNKI